MNHELKIDPIYYQRVLDGSKTFEVRDNDRGFHQGDTVTLKEYDREPVKPGSIAVKGYTDSKPLDFEIGYVYVLNSSQVIFSLLPIKKAKK